MIRHIVLFNVLPTATPQAVAEVVHHATHSLSQIPGVRNLAVSTSFEVVQPPKYQYALTMEFASEAELQNYIEHPVHQEFRKLFFPIRDDFLVMTLREVEETR